MNLNNKHFFIIWNRGKEENNVRKIMMVSKSGKDLLSTDVDVRELKGREIELCP
jgi:hypothetical protein